MPVESLRWRVAGLLLLRRRRRRRRVAGLLRVARLSRNRGGLQPAAAAKLATVQRGLQIGPPDERTGLQLQSLWRIPTVAVS